MTDAALWNKCSSCWKPIGFDSEYFACSVSTCNRPRMTRYFCSWACWDAHLPDARHRSADALKRRSPTRDAHDAADATVQRSTATHSRTSASKDHAESIVHPALSDAGEFNDAVLIVASRLKAYIDDRSQLRTSKTALEALSDRLRGLCDRAIVSAQNAERKTVMDRDLPRPPVTSRGDTVLVVVSKTKGYIKARGGFNTSNGAIPVLSHFVRAWADVAIRNARAAGQTTVMGRDIPTRDDEGHS